MTDAERQIKSELENTFDIPFYVCENQRNGEPCYCMGPENSEKEFFYIQVSFRNRIRMTAEFIPEENGDVFIRSLAESSDAHKNIFLKYMSLMQERGGKVSMIIDHTAIFPDNFKTYQGPWNHMEIKVTKIPVSDSGVFSYPDVAQEWGSLMMGMILSMAEIVQLDKNESEQVDGYAEGRRSQVLTNKYERNRINRKLCLEEQGYNCCVCGMNFEKAYGEIGHHYIHVHHIIPVSQIGAGYIINPGKDLVPICPNCHAMLHQKDPPYRPEELKNIIQTKGYL